MSWKRRALKAWRPLSTRTLFDTHAALRPLSSSGTKVLRRALQQGRWRYNPEAPGDKAGRQVCAVVKTTRRREKVAVTSRKASVEAEAKDGNAAVKGLLKAVCQDEALKEVTDARGQSSGGAAQGAEAHLVEEDSDGSPALSDHSAGSRQKARSSDDKSAKKRQQQKKMDKKDKKSNKSTAGRRVAARDGFQDALEEGCLPPLWLF